MNDKRIKMQHGVSNKEGGILVRLWRTILEETNYYNSLDYLTSRYVNDTARASSVKAGRRQTKSSLIKNITSNNMSWRTFVDLLRTFLKVKDAEFSVKLTFHNGDTSVHSVKLINQDEEDENE